MVSETPVCAHGQRGVQTYLTQESFGNDIRGVDHPGAFKVRFCITYEVEIPTRSCERVNP